MADDKEKCGWKICKKKIAQLEAWAITDGKRFCCKECYMNHIEKTDNETFNKLKVRKFK